MARRKRVFFAYLKEWWWLYAVWVAVCSGVALWWNIPTRVAHAEEELGDLKDWAKELQGYTRAQQEFNQAQQQLRPNQAAPRPLPPIEVWYDNEGRRWECDPGRFDCAKNENWVRVPDGR